MSIKDTDSLQSARAYEIAKENGWVVRLPRKDELFVDIDDEASHAKFLDQVSRYHRLTGNVKDYGVRPSKSGKPGKYHAVVLLNKEVGDVERILLQATMGSDSTRELLSFMRLQNGDPNPTLFFEK